MHVAPLTKPDLLARLGDGHAARAAVVTPNLRLARELAREFDDFQAGNGFTAWEAPVILPFTAFVARLYDEALYLDRDPDLPLPLSEAQEHELWEAAIRASEYGAQLLAVPQAAADCRRAWQLAHAWSIAGALGAFPGNEDAQAFAAWARDYARRCERLGAIDGARLSDALVPLLKEAALGKPGLLVAYAFDAVTPQQREFFDACAAIGIEVRSCGPASCEASSRRMVFESARHELEAAACWARAKLEAGARRIGVVVPDLEERRKEVVRVFARALDPLHNLPGRETRTPPFNISLGVPLAHFPVVRAALSIIELACGEIPFEQASRLLRSPFMGDSDAENAARARLDVALRERAPAFLGLGALVALVGECPLLRARLEALFAAARQGAGGERSPHDWARRFSALLAAAGFPGRSLDSAEFQARARMDELLAEFAALGRIVPTMSTTRALARFGHLCRDALFQPETPDAPIQVLGVLESAGLAFDAFWVSGLSDEAWPLAARPDPFIPPALQKKAGIPAASADGALARGRRITAGWLSAAPEVLVSHPAHEDDRALRVSPLIAAVALVAPPAQPGPCYRDLIFLAGRLESVTDCQAPPLAQAQVRSGVRILSDQAACPFRAFAHHRLAAAALEAPLPGPDARVRGILLHVLMKQLWDELGTSARLAQDCEPAIERAAAAALSQERLAEPFAALERVRLARIARAWLDLERARKPFSVVATEAKRTLRAGGLEFSGRIDRMDRLASGEHVLIDYKTGSTSRRGWLGERPEEPQLPLYAVNAKEDIAAIAFAKLKTGELGFSGYAREKGLLAGADLYRDWDGLVAGWKKELDLLGAAFAAGDARVDPKDGLQTCRSCDLQPLCRIYERIATLESGEEGE